MNPLQFSAARSPGSPGNLSELCTTTQTAGRKEPGSEAEWRAVLPTLCPHVFSEEAQTPPNRLDVAVLDNT